MHANGVVSAHVADSVTAMRAKGVAGASSAHFAPAVATTRNMHANVSSAIAFAPSGVASKGSGKSVSVTAAFTLTTNICMERSTTLNPQTLQLTSATTVCLSRSFTGEGVAFSASASVSRTYPKTISVAAAFTVSPATQRQWGATRANAIALHAAPAVADILGHKTLSLPTVGFGSQAVVTRAMHASANDNLHLVPATQVARNVPRSLFEGEHLVPAVTVAGGRSRPTLLSFSVVPNLSVVRTMHVNLAQSLTLGPITFRATPGAKNAIENEHFTISAMAREQLNANRGLAQPISVATGLAVPRGWKLKPRYLSGTDPSMALGAVVSVKSGFGRPVAAAMTVAANVTIAVNGAPAQRRRAMIIGVM